MAALPSFRLRMAWLVAGPLLMVGATWIAIYAVTASLDTAHLELINHAVGGLVGGLLLGRAVSLPSRRLLALSACSALAGVGIFTVLFLVQFAWFSWAPSRSAHPWLLAAALGGIAAAAAAGGAWLAGRGARPETPSAPTWMMVSALVTMGLLVIVANSIDVEAGGAWLLVLATIAVGGAITQLLMPARRIWVAGSGALVFGLFALERYREGLISLQETALQLGGNLVLLVPIAALGARIAWRLSRRTDAPDLPAARVQ